MYSDPDSQRFHLCIINMVIGTLYCAKGNFEFGISRIIKSVEPAKTLSADTWYDDDVDTGGVIILGSSLLMLLPVASYVQPRQSLVSQKKEQKHIYTCILTLHLYSTINFSLILLALPPHVFAHLAKGFMQGDVWYLLWSRWQSIC